MPIPPSWFRIEEEHDTDWKPEWDEPSAVQTTTIIDRPQIPEWLDIAQAWVQWNQQFLKERVNNGL